MRAAAVLIALLAACGGAGGGSGTPTGPFTVTLTAAGVSPQNFQALSQASLRFTNQDTKNHQITSSNCAEIMTPLLTPGTAATVDLGPGPKVCNFSDSQNPSAAAFQGTVSVLAPGNGY